MKTYDPCRHCGQRSGYRPGGLCRVCWADRSLRPRYVRATHHAINGGKRSPQQDFCGGYQTPEQASDAPPGSAAKQAVLAERAALGLALWHPRDAELGGLTR